MLKARNGRPFVEPTPAAEEIAAIAAALEAVMSPAALAGDARRRADRPARREPLAGAGPRAKGCADVQYEVEVGGRRLQVVVTRAGDGFAVAVDGRTRQVDAARIDAHTLSLIVDSGVVERSQSSPPIRRPGSSTVHVGATPVAVTLNGRRRWGRKDESAGAGSGTAAPGRADARQGRARAREGGRRGHGPPAGRRRRSDEDGERAARQPRRHGRRDSRAAKGCRSTPARCSSSFSERVQAPARASESSATSASCLMIVVALLAAAIVASVTIDLGPVGPRQGRGRRLQVHRAAAAHRRAADPPADRQGPGRGPHDRRPASGRSPVLHRQADRGRARLGAGVQPPARHHHHLGRDDRLADAGREVGRRAQLPALQPRRRQAAGSEAVHDHAEVSARVPRPVRLRGSRDAVERDLPQPRHQHHQPAELSRHRDLHRRHGRDSGLRADVGEHEGRSSSSTGRASTSIGST